MSLNYQKYFEGLFVSTDPLYLKIKHMATAYGSVVPVYVKTPINVNIDGEYRWLTFFALVEYDFTEDGICGAYPLRAIRKDNPTPLPREEDLDMRDYIHEDEMPYRMKCYFRDRVRAYRGNWDLREVHDLRNELAGKQ